MSVNIRNPLTGELTNASGGVINPKSINEMIAPIEDGTASKAYAVGEQFIMNDLLCEATQAIAQGDTMVIGTNCEESEQLSKQVKDINASLTANGNRFEASYSNANDEYGFNIGSTFYPIGASSGGGDGVVPLLDFDNAISLTTTNYTTTKDGAVIIGGYTSANTALYINDVSYGKQWTTSSCNTLTLYGVPKGTNLRVDVAPNSNIAPKFVPYTYATVDPTITVYNGVDINFNYANPLHTFSSGNLSYTAIKDCWLIGTLWGSNGQNKLSINGVEYFRGYHQDNSMLSDCNILTLKLTRGDVVTVDQAVPYLHVLEGSVVSPEVTVFNEAEVELNYTTPLHTFSSGNLSYTATKTCYLCGALIGDASAMSINGISYGRAHISGGSTGTDSFNIPIYKLSANDVVTVNNAQSYLHVLEGTISGSVGALHSNIPNYSKKITDCLVTDNQDGSYTATKECIVEITYYPHSSTAWGEVCVNNNVVGRAYFNNPYLCIFVKSIHLQVGDTLSWTKSGTSSHFTVFEPL